MKKLLFDNPIRKIQRRNIVFFAAISQVRTASKLENLKGSTWCTCTAKLMRADSSFFTRWLSFLCTGLIRLNTWGEMGREMEIIRGKI